MKFWYAVPGVVTVPLMLLPSTATPRDNSLFKEILEWLKQLRLGNKMGANLIQSLQEIRDFRASQGRRYPLWLILLLVIMGTISGCRSYYALEDFGARHYGEVSEQLGLKVTRLPSDTTFRRILQKLDFQTLAIQFEQWVNSTFTLEPGEWVAVDGFEHYWNSHRTRHGISKLHFFGITL